MIKKPLQLNHLNYGVGLGRILGFNNRKKQLAYWLYPKLAIMMFHDIMIQDPDPTIQIRIL